MHTIKPVIMTAIVIMGRAALCDVIGQTHNVALLQSCAPSCGRYDREIDSSCHGIICSVSCMASVLERVSRPRHASIVTH